MSNPIGNIFQNTQKQLAEKRKPKATVIEVTGYELGNDPKDHRMLGKDLLNKDENGVPKAIKVAVYDPDDKVQGVKDYAKKNSLVHTEVGGLVRLDRYIERNNGEEYVARHLGRIAPDSSMSRQDENGNNYKLGFDQAWVSIKPYWDNQTNGPKVFNTRGGGTIHRANARIIPVNAQPQEVRLGKNALADLTKAAEAAIDARPDKSDALVLVRHQDDPNKIEFVIRSTKQDAQGNYVPMEKQEMLEAFKENSMLAAFLQNAGSVQDEGLTMEAVPGYQMSIFGSTVNLQTGDPQKSRVEMAMSDTRRWFPKPNPEDPGKPFMQKGGLEYSKCIVSYSIPEAKGGPSLETIGKMPGETASPNAGLAVTPNPYMAQWEALRNEQPAPVASTGTAQPAARQAAQPTQQATQSQQAVAAQAPIDQTTAVEVPTQTAPVEEPPLPGDDEVDGMLAGDDFDFDMDDFEDQMAGQGL